MFGEAQRMDHSMPHLAQHEKSAFGGIALRISLKVAPYLLIAAGLVGCASDIPLVATLLPDNDVMMTGSILSSPSPFSPNLTATDWVLAKNSLDTALGPDNTAKAITWSNVTTHARGSFRPLGSAFVRDGALCRSFLAEIAILSVEKTRMQATACRIGAEPWQIGEIRLAKKSI